MTRLRRKRAARKRPPKLPPVVEALQRARKYQGLIATGEAKDRADLGAVSDHRATPPSLARQWPDPDDQLVGLERITGVALERDAGEDAFAVTG